MAKIEIAPTAKVRRQAVQSVVQSRRTFEKEVKRMDQNEATEQQSSQVANGCDRQAMNPDVQSAALIDAIRKRGNERYSEIMHRAARLTDLGDIDRAQCLVHEAIGMTQMQRLVVDCVNELAQVRHDAERVAAD